MKFSTAILATAAIVAVNSAPLMRRNVNPALVPEFGIQPGVNPTGTGYAPLLYIQRLVAMLTLPKQ